VDVSSPIDLRKLDAATEWKSTAMAKRPWRVDFFDSISRSIAAARHVLELGSGPGFLAEHLLRGDPDVQLVLLDFSPAMHELARRRLGDVASRVEFIVRDFKSPIWTSALSRFDAVVTNQAAHEVRHKSHAASLHDQVRTVLASEGSYLVSDHFVGKGGTINASLYMTVEEQRKALEGGGFAEVTEVLRKRGLVLHKASRPKPVGHP
jgi:ubiquinone/menaquinone biosynthesis C-methylase UbiE